MGELTITQEKDENQTENEKITDNDLPVCFTQERHLEKIEGITFVEQTWRMKERMKTVSVALVLCLNVGVDPPDIVKTQPCARLECWIDPSSLSPNKALDKIGQSLQTQYERWQPRARYKQSLDPNAEEVKKLCTSLRRNAKEERVLFHYNGHGVPKPTSNGEIWVFNRNFTQYIPLSIFDLQTWMGAPSIYVYDCSNAGIIVESFKRFASQHEAEFELAMTAQQKVANPQQRGSSPANSQRGVSPQAPTFNNCIQLAACSENQVLPMNPELPADLFTACLTTPIKVALRWYVLQSTSKLVPKVTLDIIDKIPGQITDRRTMLGELNWIFTAITDTIAWNTLPRDLFQKLFRQDLLVASLFRNFLLAERIMRSCDCTPVSSPALPPTFQHSMWNAWDLALDLSLGQLPGIIKCDAPFQHLPFFEEQLTAFQVWLELGSEERNPPEQLPIVLQVLLSQVHRMRALELLGKFLDLGPWAVNLALSVGIFPYVLKLLQSCAKELRPLLVFIWAKILAVDNVSDVKTCQADLVRDGGHKYFLSVLQDTSVSAEHRTQATFVLACIVNDYRDGQEAAFQGSLISICLEQLNDPCPQLRQWVAICLGRLWDGYESARWTGVRDNSHDKMFHLLKDPCPEVRAAAVYALGTFINSVTERSEHANSIDQTIVMMLLNNVSHDMSSLVRKELVNALQWFVLTFSPYFTNVAMRECRSPDSNVSTPIMRRIGSRDRLKVNEDTVDRIKRVSSSSSINNIGMMTMSSHSNSLGSLPGLSYGSVYMKVWMSLCVLEKDPYPEVATMCRTITEYIRNLVKEIEEKRMSSSLSLPPSPNTRGSYLSGESPPSSIHSSSSDLQRLSTSRSAMANRTRKVFHTPIINEEEEKTVSYNRKPLVSTNFVAWSSKRFAQPHKKEKIAGDTESKRFYERDWRHARNDNVRLESMTEQRRVQTSKVESLVFHSRTALPPSLLQLHPFDQQIAVAGKDSFAIWDWGTGAKTSQCQCKSSKTESSRISALEWINGHDVAMLMVASDDGSVKLYKPNCGQHREPKLVSAWEACSDLKLARQSGVLLAWEQWTQTAITGGDTRHLRFWDAERELRSFEVPTGTDSSATCLNSTFSAICHDTHKKYSCKNDLNDDGLTEHGRGDGSCNSGGAQGRIGLAVIGCADGSVRAFDRRLNPTEARIRTYMEHAGAVLGLQVRDNFIISGSAGGDVKIFDVRKNNSVLSTKVAPMSCMSIHRFANTYACGSLSQSISIYTLNGTLLNSVRVYEGFMASRIGPVTCLNFHPHKVSLAAGFSDCAINVYSIEAGRR